MDREDIHERLAVGTRWDGCWALAESEGGSSYKGSSDEGVGAAGPTFLLSALVDPEVGHPPGSILFSPPASQHSIFDQIIQTTHNI